MPTPTKKRKRNKLKLDKLKKSSEIEELDEHTDSTKESEEFEGLEEPTYILSETLRKREYRTSKESSETKAERLKKAAAYEREKRSNESNEMNAERFCHILIFVPGGGAQNSSVMTHVCTDEMYQNCNSVVCSLKLRPVR